MMWPTVELHEIRVFLTLADELHFGRTADRLHLSGSRVSQILRGLEAKMDCQLVHRTSRRVELSATGERFRDELRPAYEQLLAVVERLGSGGSSFGGTLRLGLLTPGADGPHLPTVVSAFRRRHPDCEVEVDRAPYGEAFDLLRGGEIDLLATWLPHGQRDLVTGPTLCREARVLAVGEEHALAGRPAVRLEEIADYRVLPMEQVMPTEMAEAWAPRKTPSGRPIRRLKVPFGAMARRDAAALRHQMSWWIRTGEIVHPSVATVETILGSGIKYLPISDLKPVTSALVWPRAAADARLREFARVARDVLPAR